MKKVRLDKKGRVTISIQYRRILGLTKEVVVVLEEDHLIISKTSMAMEFRGASKKLAEEIAGTREEPIEVEKLF